MFGALSNLLTGKKYKKDGSIMRIETDRLIIRSVKFEDEMFFPEMAKDGSLVDVGFDRDCGKWMADWIREVMQLDEEDNPGKDYLVYTVCLKHSGAVIGGGGCTYYEDLKQTGITYFIGSEYRGNGYAAESVKAYTDYFFNHYSEKKLIATIRDENVPSWKRQIFVS